MSLDTSNEEFSKMIRKKRMYAYNRQSDSDRQTKRQTALRQGVDKHAVFARVTWRLRRVIELSYKQIELPKTNEIVAT